MLYNIFLHRESKDTIGHANCVVVMQNCVFCSCCTRRGPSPFPFDSLKFLQPGHQLGQILKFPFQRLALFLQCQSLARVQFGEYISTLTVEFQYTLMVLQTLRIHQLE